MNSLKFSGFDFPRLEGTLRPVVNLQRSMHAMSSLRSEATEQGEKWYGADVRHLAIFWTKTPMWAGRSEEPLRRH